ncbi:EmrB/QacA family drug resistance transporter [Cellulomonas chitinilytica]|uniref:EmrB/QacA family drug resistance transporter n=1 Tax=Cellulomonas chitinilytica TaxID=398759 RepID=A0A919TYM6_9CELL|nr:MDR family MFS transporter [Cellulomonas chitinilytica]GIG20765.1 EmrB/QacA family drug resistance transporter [Cellulomonas chitinilytica]
MTKQESTEAPVEGDLDQRAVWAVFGGLMLAMLLAALDQTIVATALPTIVRDLGGAEHLSWVVTAYMLASTATTPLWGKLGDLYGRKVVFLVCIVIFLAGSALAGTSQTMLQLIAWRALQGVGGGGLMVLAQAIIGDVVPPRDRGRYQGAFGAVFGLSSVAGPLLGGWFVDNLTWRWVFYVNLPIGLVALVVVSAVLPSTRSHRSPKIDYVGITLLATIATCIVLVTSLGGSTWEWASVQVVGLSLLAVVSVVAFGFVEARVPEPVMPLRLFRNRVFSTTAVVGFVVGFAMFGSITYLPLYLQQVQGASPTGSGLQMIPMMLGILLTSISSGQIISRTGRYKVFPIVGSAVFTVGLYLLSLMGRDTTAWQSGLSMFVLGAGLGMVMQVLVLAVQNAVEYRDLGVGTSGATFFRTIGSCVGVAVFGTLFTSHLTSGLAAAPPPDAVGPCSAETLSATSAALPTCSAAVQDWFLDGYSDAIHTIFLYAVPVGILAFALSWLIPEVTLRTAAHVPEQGEVYALPSSRTSYEELRLLLWREVGHQDPLRAYAVVVRDLDVDLTPGQCWMLARVTATGSRTVDAMVASSHVERARVEATAEALRTRGLVEVDDGTVTPTDAGHALADRVRDHERALLRRMVDEWEGSDEPALDVLVDQVTDRLWRDDPSPAGLRG